MKSVNLWSAILGGVGGTFAMTVLMYMAPLMGLPPMDLLWALGSLIPLGLSPYVVGGLIHLGIGVGLALLYVWTFERLVPGPRWARGALFSLLPWLFAITLMGPAMAWLQGALSPPAQAQTAVNPCAVSRPANPYAVSPAPQVANPCAVPPRPVNPCGISAPRPVNPCAPVASGVDAPSPWVLRMMSLMAHLLYGGVMATLYRRPA